jgi:hypothetical protein
MVTPAVRSGSRRTTVPVAVALAAVMAASLGLVLTRPGASAAAGRNGALPGWLPSAAVPVGRVVTATSAHPWLAIEGDSVRADLARGDALVTVVGPAVPEEGGFPVPATTPCTFTVTFARAAGHVPLRASAFTITDELGHLHHPLVTLQGGGPLPSRVSSGHLVTLSVSDVLPTGNGSLHWAPAGSAPLVSWDFDVEID